MEYSASTAKHALAEGVHVAMCLWRRPRYYSASGALRAVHALRPCGDRSLHDSSYDLTSQFKALDSSTRRIHAKSIDVMCISIE